MAMLKLTTEQIDVQAQHIVSLGDQGFAEVQSTIYAMIGGGMLANFAVRQPKDFYIDTRVGGLNYSKRAIEQAVAILARAAELRGIPTDHGEIPDYRVFHLNLGVY